MALEKVIGSWGQLSYYGTSTDMHLLPYVPDKIGAKFYNLTDGTIYTFANRKWNLSENPLNVSSPVQAYTKLVLPVVSISAGGVVTWESVSYASDYSVVVITNGVAGDATKKTSGSVTLTAGQSIKVRANGATSYLHSDFSEAKEYEIPTISYVSRLGTPPATINNTSGTIPSSALTLLASQGGFYCEGWYLEPTCQTKATTSTTLTSGQHITLYANWLPSTYTITYVLNDGTNDANNPVSYNTTKVYALAPAIKSGARFLGWYDKASNGELVSKIAPGMTGNKTLYAYFEWDTYSITYVLNGSTNHASNPNVYTKNTDTITLNNASRVGYAFNGWYDNADFSGSAITTIAKGSTGNKVLYAKLTKVDYTLSYNFAGIASVTNPNTITAFTVDNLPIILQSASKTNYDFGGWYKESAYTNVITAITVDNLNDIVSGTTATVYGKLTYNELVALNELDTNTTADLTDSANALTLVTSFAETINAVLNDYKLDYKLDFSDILTGISEGTVSISAITYAGASLTLGDKASNLLTNQVGFLSEYVSDFARASVVNSKNTTPNLVVTIANASGSTLSGDVVFEVLVSKDNFTTSRQIAIDTEQVSIIDTV